LPCFLWETGGVIFSITESKQVFDKIKDVMFKVSLNVFYVDTYVIAYLSNILFLVVGCTSRGQETETSRVF
jgi:hypothetical protein